MNGDEMNTPWWKQPNRVMLLNLREGDEPLVEARAFVEDVKRYGATAFCINGGGIVAFYQTKIPGQRISATLGERDLLAEIIPEAHRQGLRVLARIDPSCAPRELAAEHPDWFARDREGNYFEVSGHYVTCPNAGYYHGRMVEVVQEMVRRYDADGIWNNQGKFAAWDTDACYCPTCQRLFRESSGHAIPEKEDWDSPVWRQFNEWRYRRIAAWVQRMHQAIHEVKADAIFISAIQLAESLETIRPGGWDVDYWLEHQDVVAFECQRRNTAPWWPGMQAKYLAGIAPDKPRWMTVSYFYPWWRLYAAPEAENRPWVAQQFANGVNSWLHINGGLSPIFDRRGLAPMQEVFQRLGQWEGYFGEAKSAAQVALVFSRYTQDNYGRDDPYGRYMDSVRGYYAALSEAHIPFDVLSDKFLAADRLAQYRVLVLPNTACLSDAAVAAVRAFAANGGTVVATYDAARHDEQGVERAEAPLAAMLGGRHGARRRKLQSSYGFLAQREDPLLQGLGDTDVVPNDGDLLEFVPGPGSAVPLTLIPPVTAHSGATISIPEFSAVRGSTDVPVVAHGAHGRGRVVLFANRMDALFYKYGFPDLGRILANAVRLGLGDAEALEVDAPDYVDVTLQAQPGRRLVHLINFAVGKHVNTGWRHPGRNLVPVQDIRVRLRVSPGEKLRAVRSATDEAVLPHHVAGAWAEVTVPRLQDHEIVVFELDA
jgi:hypothetical protein